METMETIRVFLGWCTAINLCLMVLTSIILVGGRKAVAGIHARMLDLDERTLSAEYMRYMSQFKVLFLVFNLVPYIALRIVA